MPSRLAGRGQCIRERYVRISTSEDVRNACCVLRAAAGLQYDSASVQALPIAWGAPQVRVHTRRPRPDVETHLGCLSATGAALRTCSTACFTEHVHFVFLVCHVDVNREVHVTSVRSSRPAEFEWTTCIPPNVGTAKPALCVNALYEDAQPVLHERVMGSAAVHA